MVEWGGLRQLGRIRRIVPPGAGGLSPESRRGSGGVFDGYGEKRSFVIASDSRGKNKSMGTASGFQPFIRT